MSADPARAVFDCNIFFQAFLSPRGPAHGCVEAVLDKRVVLLLSREIISETREVLSRPFIRERFPEVNETRIEAFLAELTYVAEVWRAVPRVLICERDPADEPYLNLAAAGKAHYLVTRDADLLSLATDHSSDGKRFRQVTQNRVQIVVPDILLERLQER